MRDSIELSHAIPADVDPRGYFDLFGIRFWAIKGNPEGKAAVQSEDGQTLADFAFMLDLDGDIPPVIIV